MMTEGNSITTHGYLMGSGSSIQVDVSVGPRYRRADSAGPDGRLVIINETQPKIAVGRAPPGGRAGLRTTVDSVRRAAR
jgi:hypothetical protein